MGAIPIEPSQTNGGGGGGGGTIGGTIAANQIAYGSGLDTIAGTNNLQWLGGDLLKVTGAVWFTGNGIAFGQQTTTAINYTVLSSDFLVRVVPVPAATVTITLPFAGTAILGQMFVIKDGAGFASVMTPMIISARVGETVDGALTQTFTSPYTSITVINNGVSWDII